MEHRFKNSDWKYLTVGLPEDIEKLKWYGDFERAERVINMRLEKDIPEPLRRRLELEKWVLRRLPLKYVYDKEQALKALQATLTGATKEELERLEDEGAVDWIFVNEKVHYRDNFVENLLKTRKELWDRLKDPSMANERIEAGKLLDKTVLAMKEKGGLAYRMQIRASVKVEKEAERVGEFIRIHLPIPVETGQVKNFKLLKTSMEPVFIAPADYPQRTVCMETKLEPDQEFWIEYEFENHTEYSRLKQEDVKENQALNDLAPYLEETLPQIRFTPYMRELTGQVVMGEKNPLIKARKIYDYITTHVMYSFVRQYSTIANLPEFMATSLKGDCGIYALLFITMCRIAKIPAKWQAGLYATPLSIGCHDWAQFYIDPYGWLYADCSFGGSAWRDQKKERWDFYFGNLDPFRVPMCSEFQYDFWPAKDFYREDPYDNQVGEAEYRDRGLINGLEYQTDKQVLAIQAL